MFNSLTSVRLPHFYPRVQTEHISFLVDTASYLAAHATIYLLRYSKLTRKPSSHLR